MCKNNGLQHIHYGRSLTRDIKYFILLFMLFLSTTVRADIAVIVNADQQGVALGREQIQMIFLGIKTSLPNGSPIAPIDLDQGSEVRQMFYRLVADRSAVEMRSYWARLIFTGRGKPPIELSSQSAVVSKVASDKNAIGYVNAANVAAGVKVALLIPTAGKIQ